MCSQRLIARLPPGERPGPTSEACAGADIGAHPRWPCSRAGPAGETIALPPGSTDAALTPYHIDRSKQWVASLYAGVFTEEHRLPAVGPERDD